MFLDMGVFFFFFKLKVLLLYVWMYVHPGMKARGQLVKVFLSPCVPLKSESTFSFSGRFAAPYLPGLGWDLGSYVGRHST